MFSRQESPKPASLNVFCLIGKAGYSEPFSCQESKAPTLKDVFKGVIYSETGVTNDYSQHRGDVLLHILISLLSVSQYMQNITFVTVDF